MDVTPTILDLLGVPVPSHIEGSPIRPSNTQDPANSEFNATRVDPAETTLDGPHQHQFEYTAEEQAIIEQRLADLGYLE